MLRYQFFLVLFLITYLTASSQEKRDLGLQLGGSYYLGDYNIGKPLYQPSPAVGILFKYNLNNYYSLRFAATYGHLKGNYSPNDNYLPLGSGDFNKKLVEVEASTEINFLAFDTRQYKKQKFSPYFTIGVGMAYIEGQILPHIPFGIGLKISAGSRTAVGFEWRMHKTLSDKIDNYENLDDGTKAFLHNNDWFSFAGIFLTYRLFNYSYTCPAYR